MQPETGKFWCHFNCIRLGWMNYLRPDLKSGNFLQQWSRIAAELPGRSDNKIKNYWNSYLKKKLKERGIDPIIHKPFDLQPDDNSDANANIANGSLEWMELLQDEGDSGTQLDEDVEDLNCYEYLKGSISVTSTNQS